MDRQLLFIELNEVNFEAVAFYCGRGKLPTFAALFERHGWTVTRSEQRYEELEPWIQWVTAHTGATLAEHKVFRLGDIVHSDFPQIWERLEERGLKVGAISPMNAKHRLAAPAFFVPDPWTRTGLTAAPRLKALHAAIAQAVNDNAQQRLTPTSFFQLLAGFLTYARPGNYGQYLRLALGSAGKPWRKAMLLDLLLADVFIRETASSSPHFATLFVNAAAHIQHHYMFSSASYAGANRNPAWYVDPNDDPVLEVYAAYDRILAAITAAFPQARLMLGTGLHQVPHDRVTFYWRLRRHESLLGSIGVPFVRIEPRMSRDFLVVCADERQAADAQRVLASAVASDGTPVFEVDNRGHDLFVMLAYPREIAAGFAIRAGERTVENFDREVAFVALKNGEHHGDGYFLDTGLRLGMAEDAFPLAALPQRIMDAFGFERSAVEGASKAA